MRTMILLSVALGVSVSANAAKPISLDQLEQFLGQPVTKSDGKYAWKLADFELTERMSTDELARLSEHLPGPESRDALQALADESQVLEPPASEIPAITAPATEEQRKMMALVVGYVGKTIPQLPNFFAERKTQFFLDSPLLAMQNSIVLSAYRPLHRVRDSQVTVLYRDGREVVDAGKAKSQTGEVGLSTWGVFGPILGTVLVDAARSQLTWSHWEQDRTGRRAVFRFDVPQEKSHYEVSYCCTTTESATMAATVHPFRELVGYRGAMTIDPESGTILRLVLIAAMKSDDPVTKANIVVDYAPVEIGGKSYYCPVRSISSTVAQSVQLDPRYRFYLANQSQPLRKELSEARFEQYHMFRSDARLMNEKEARLAGVSGGGEEAAAEPAEPAEKSESGIEAKTQARAEPEPTAAAPAVAAAKSEPEIRDTPLSGVPDLPASPTGSAPSSEFTLRTTSKLVDISLVAFDKKGHPVTDLKAEDVAIFDEGAPQKISFFSQAGGSGELQEPNSERPADDHGGTGTFTNRPANSDSRVPPVKSAAHATILMIDASNVAFSDLSYARSEMQRFLKSTPADEPVGLYILRSYTFEILREPTADHAAIANALAKWVPSAQDLAHAQEQEDRNREHFDYVHSLGDLASVNGNEGTDPSTYSSGGSTATALADPKDAKLQPMGDNAERAVMPLLVMVAQHLAGIPGHKNLVWVASDNVLANWRNDATAKESEEGPQYVHSIALRAQEAMNNAHVSLYPLDASQLEGGGVGADIGTRNIVPFGMSDRDKAMDGLGDIAPVGKNGRDSARMKEDTRPIQPEFRELADNTGGRALRRAGDIAGELDGIVADGRAAYQVSFVPGAQPDNAYHHLVLKPVGRTNLTLRYRAGYFYGSDTRSLRDRLRDVLMESSEAREIGVGASLRREGKDLVMTLNISGTDLGLAQRDALWTDTVDVFVVTQEAAKQRAKIAGRSLALRLSPGGHEKMLHDGLVWETPIGFARVPASLRILVVDESTGHIGSVTIPRSALVEEEN